MEDLELKDIQEKVLKELDNFNKISLSNDIYNAESVRESEINLIKKLENLYNVNIDYITYEIERRV